MTLPEVLLWRALRARPEGLKFRRQHPAGPYVLDFYCEAARLAVEVDGEAHERGTAPAFDAARDEWLHDAGIRTLRIPAAEVLEDVEAVVLGIVERCRAIPLHRPSGGPPPLQGGSL
jgi:very-short-patch-repair endonuclease